MTRHMRNEKFGESRTYIYSTGIPVSKPCYLNGNHHLEHGLLCAATRYYLASNRTENIQGRYRKERMRLSVGLKRLQD